jgi:cell division protein FtsA
MAEFIVAIDLGTSHLTGVVGEKKENGTFSILACETEDTISRTQKGETEETNSCIYRGIIYNRDHTATHVGNLLRKLEAHLKGGFIDKVYVGIGGQSLHTIDHIEAMEMEDGTAVTEDDLAVLKEKCGRYKPDLLDVLGMAPPVYYLDGRKDTAPVGVTCRRIEAHYKLVAGRSMIRHDITKSIESIPDKSLAGIIVSPMALADAILSPKDKELGCALVDFGAGVTAVSVYKDGDLKHLCIIPLGGNLITRDITALQLTKEEAEKLKVEKGSAIVGSDDENRHIQIEMEDADREIKLSDLNAIIEGRAKEIVENVYARIADATELRHLGAGIVTAGCAAELTDLTELIKDKCKVNARFSMIQKGPVQGADEMLGNPLYMMAISLMLKGTENCVSFPQTQQASQPDLKTQETARNETPPKTPDKQKHSDKKSDKPDRKDKTGLKAKVMSIFTQSLFEEQ